MLAFGRSIVLCYALASLNQAEICLAQVLLDFSAPLSQDRKDSWTVVRFHGTADVQLVPGAQAKPRTDFAKVAWLKCNDSSFSINRELTIDPSVYRIISWQWSAVKIPDRGDFRKRGLVNNRDDQVLQVMVLFPGKRTLSYVWDSNAPKEASELVSYFGYKTGVIVVESGKERVGQWTTVRRNLWEDYRKLHGGEPRETKGVRIQTNSQHTEDYGEGYIGPIHFLKE